MAAGLLATGCIPGAGAPSTVPGASGSTAPTPVPAPTSSGPRPSPSFVRPTPTPLPTFATHTVQGGDTLSSIARVYDTTPRSIAYWNGTTYPSLDPERDEYDPDRIEVGWVLQLIPGVEIPEDMIPTPSPTAT